MVRAVKRPIMPQLAMVGLALIFLLGSVASAVKVKSRLNSSNSKLSTEISRQNQHLKKGAWMALLKEYRTLVSAGNVPSDLHFLLGRLYFTLGQFTTAIIELEECIDLTPDHRQALFCLGKCYLDSGRLDSLESHLAGPLSAYSKEADYAFLRGSLNLRLGRYSEAINCFRKSGGKRESIQALLQESTALYLSGNLKSAESTLHKILSKEPRIGAAHEIIALIYIRQGRLEESLDEFAKVGASGSSGDRSRSGKSILYRVMEGKLSEYQLVTYFQARDLDSSLSEEKIDLLEEISDNPMPFPEANLELAIAYGKEAEQKIDGESVKGSGRKSTKEIDELNQKAYKCLMKACQSKYATEQMWFRLGMYYLENKNDRKAEEAFRRSVEMNNQFTEGHFRLGNCLLNKKLYQKAFNHFCKVIELSPLDSRAYALAGKSLISQGQQDQGQHYVDEAILLDPYSSYN
jgi:tetratricopeptide (TPR) repeat protein